MLGEKNRNKWQKQIRCIPIRLLVGVFPFDLPFDFPFDFPFERAGYGPHVEWDHWSKAPFDLNPPPGGECEKGVKLNCCRAGHTHPTRHSRRVGIGLKGPQPRRPVEWECRVGRRVGTAHLKVEWELHRAVPKNNP